MLEAGCDIRTIQELLGHKDDSTTMIHAHVLNKRAMACVVLWIGSDPVYAVCISPAQSVARRH